jgi:hypothetical protein
VFNRTETTPAAPAAAWTGPTFESHVENFKAGENDKQVAARLSALGAEGWQIIAVLDKSLTGGFSKGLESWSVLLQRRLT